MDIDGVRKKKRYFYTIKEKLSIIDYYNTFTVSRERKYSKNDVYRKFGIDHKSFNEWLENEEQ